MCWIYMWMASSAWGRPVVGSAGLLAFRASGPAATLVEGAVWGWPDLLAAGQSSPDPVVGGLLRRASSCGYPPWWRCCSSVSVCGRGLPGPSPAVPSLALAGLGWRGSLLASLGRIPQGGSQSLRRVAGSALTSA